MKFPDIAGTGVSVSGHSFYHLFVTFDELFMDLFEHFSTPSHQCSPFCFFIITNYQNKNKKSKFIPLTKLLRCFLQCLTCTFPEACRWFALFFILVKRQYTHSCSQFRNAITPRQAFGYYFSDLQKLSGWVEIDLFRHLNKPREAGSGNWILDVMNIAGPSGTNKQLPKPPPPPRPLLSSMDLQKRENKLEILLCLISFP